jgi:hypothetical protein
MLIKINMHTKQAPEFDLESQIHYSSCLFLPERERHYFSRPCDSSIGNDCGYTDSDYPRTVVFGH